MGIDTESALTVQQFPVVGFTLPGTSINMAWDSDKLEFVVTGFEPSCNSDCDSTNDP